MTSFDCALYDVPTPFIERSDAIVIYLLNLLFEEARGISRVIISHKDAWQEEKLEGFIRKKRKIIEHPEWASIQIRVKVAPDKTNVFRLYFEEGKKPSLGSHEDLYYREKLMLPVSWEQREATLNDLKAFDWVLNNLKPAELPQTASYWRWSIE